MVIGVGNNISAEDYNAIRNDVFQVLGSGDGGQIGYGQTLVSSEVSSGVIVRAQNLIELYTDINTAYVHQNGVNIPTNILTMPSTDDTVFAEQGTSSFTDFENAANNIFVNRTNYAANQMDVSVVGSNTRSTSWNGSISHVFTITFASSSARRYFFNSGGEIRIDANLSGGTSSTPNSKDAIWQNMLSTMGTIRFGRTTTTRTGSSGSGSSIGNYDLTTVYQRIFTKSGSGVYSENEYYIDARAPSSSTIQFRITFADNDIGDDQIDDQYTYRVDENVTGTILSQASTFRAVGALTISNPSYTLNSSL